MDAEYIKIRNWVYGLSDTMRKVVEGLPFNSSVVFKRLYEDDEFIKAYNKFSTHNPSVRLGLLNQALYMNKDIASILGSDEAYSKQCKVQLVKVLDDIYGIKNDVNIGGGDWSEPIHYDHGPIIINLKENIMSIDTSIAVQSITYIYGVDQANVTDAQIFDRITNLESQIAELTKIKVKSTKRDEKVKSLKENIQSLVEIVDNR